jgi:uncharacterized protein DUF4154
MRRAAIGFARSAGTAAVLLALAFGPSRAGEIEKMNLPLDEQVPTFLKALAYDRNLRDKARGDILIGLLYAESDVESEAAARNVAKLIASSPMKAIGDLPVFYRMIPYKDKTDLNAIISEEWVEVLYLAPGVSTLLDSVLAISSASKVLTVTGVPDYVRRGASLGLDKRDGHAEMIVNLPSALAEGSEFESQFLNLCTVLRPEPAARGSMKPAE